MGNISKIQLPSGEAYEIAESIDSRIFRATCSTSASTAAKVAVLDKDVNFSLDVGVRVAVTFTYGNSATTPTLRVDGTETGTAKTIAIPTSATAFSTGNGTTYNTWGPYETIIFTYNGTYWIRGEGRAIYNAYQKSQNVFSKVKVGSSTIEADSADDTIELVAGDNITLTPDTTNDKLTITATGGGSGNYLPLSGGTMDSGAYIDISATGGIKFNNAANGAIYSDSGDLVIENAGTGDLYICDLADPSVSTDAANKNYVDTLHGKSIAYKRGLTSSDNVNNITDTGVYYIAGSTPTGIASTYAYSYLTVINNGYYIIQELRKPVNGVLAIREKSGDPATWKDWVWTDLVVDSGTHTTNGSFKWEKWSNGRARIWGYYTAGSTSLTTSYGNLYFKGSANSFTFPSGLFNAAPLKINLTGYVSSGIVGASCSSISASSISFFIWSAKSESKSVYVYMDIEGTWK